MHELGSPSPSSISPTRTEGGETKSQREVGRRLSLTSRWAGEVSIPIAPVKSGELYRLSYRPARRMEL
jgi:hypothetical protein